MPKFNSQSSDLFQAANVFLCIRLIICIGTGIGLFNCKTTDGEYFCIWWDPEALDSLTNLVSIHDTIAGIWVFVCVYWKILFPLYDFIGIRFDEGFYGGEDKYVQWSTDRLYSNPLDSIKNPERSGTTPLQLAMLIQIDTLPY